MIPFFKKFTLVLCAGLTILSLSGCGSSKAEETTAPTLEPIVLPTAPQETEAAIAPEKLEEHLTVVMDAGELYTLDYYPNLKSVDLSGSTCYSAILDFAGKRPHLDVTFTVPVGMTDISSKASSVSLKPDSYSYDLLMENLKYLPNLTTLSLPQVNLTTSQLSSLREAYPEITLDYTVDLLGSPLSLDITELDLSSMGSSGVDEACLKLGQLPNLTDVTLSTYKDHCRL